MEEVVGPDHAAMRHNVVTKEVEDDKLGACRWSDGWVSFHGAHQ